MKVTVFGTGYVGLVHAAVLAEAGHQVVCIDINKEKIEGLRRGVVPIFEPGLAPIIEENFAAGRLIFTTEPEEGVRSGQIIFIAVGTPSGEDGSADLTHVLTVAKAIAQHIERDAVIVVKSTVPVGTSDKVRAAIREGLDARRVNFEVAVVSNPEFLKEGSAVSDSMKPDRIIIGTDDSRAEAMLRELYAPFNRNHEKIIVMDVRSSELTKYVANCLLATKITFVNEMAVLADRLGADIENVRRGIGSDPRIGYDFIYAGIGYGGSCFPKDVRALIRTSAENGVSAGILEAVERRNISQKSVLVEKIKERFGDRLTGRVFGVWGLAFKPNTDDMREAPASVIMEMLWEAGAVVRAYDPVAMEECRHIHKDQIASGALVLVESKEEALRGADALVICTEWKAFLAPDFVEIRAALTEPVIFDGRNIYNPKTVARYGLDYQGVGRRGAHGDTLQLRGRSPSSS
jgi:UDPglucose 6-dehydrogenase